MRTTARALSLGIFVITISYAVACGPSVSSSDYEDAGVGDDAQSDGAVGVDAGAGADAGADAGSSCGDEVCGDGLDNDCDGDIDNGCACSVSAEADCYTGPQATRNVGACADGVMVCESLSDDEFTQWGPCQGDVTPAAEVCDVGFVDEDCDGQSNEGCDCIGDEVVDCGSDVGACQAGTQECSGGVLGPCTGAVGPTAETCDNVDEDCDGSVDEGLFQACGTDEGLCEQGESECVAGEWQACTGGVGPTDEVCDAFDNDCDADVDEDTALVCGVSGGACQQGTQQCVGGAYDVCMGNVDPTAETCNDVDDDCDGPVDEDLVQACGTDTGVCQAGTETCSAGQWGACQGEIGPDTPGPDEDPDYCDMLDSDCDGTVDEGCACTDGATSPCGTTDTGECALGEQTCSMGDWGACVGEIGPQPEICGNGLDEDCDGVADNGCDGPLVTCSASPTDVAPLDTVTLSASGSDPDGGTVTYLWEVVTRPLGSTSEPADPTAASTTFFVDLAGSYEIMVTVTDDEGDTATCTVTFDAIPPQDIHVQLVWDTSWGDADLHVLRPGTDPATDWYRIGFNNNEYDCFFANDQASWPPNGPDGNGSLDIDDTDGFGPENINVAQAPQNGTYHIGVAYYCSHSLGPPPIDPGDGPTDATVRVFCGGVLAAEYTNINLDETGRFVHVADIDWPGCAGVSVNASSWTAEIQPPNYASPIHCAISCNGDNDCTPGEVCSSGTCVLE